MHVLTLVMVEAFFDHIFPPIIANNVNFFLLLMVLAAYITNLHGK